MNDHELLVWTDELASGDARIDETHQEFVVLVNALILADDADLLPRLQAFEQHARAHFGEEDRQMQQRPYPSAGCHVDEHRAVLASIAEVLPLLAAGRTQIARELAAELVRWFPEHTEEMDKSFVRWRVREELGGAAPLRFHRLRDGSSRRSQP